MVAGLVFAVGISLVLIGGAQMFTGDVLMGIAGAIGLLKAVRVLRVWTLVWIGNLIGSLGIALLVLLWATTIRFVPNATQCRSKASTISTAISTTITASISAARAADAS